MALEIEALQCLLVEHPLVPIALLNILLAILSLLIFDHRLHAKMRN